MQVVEIYFSEGEKMMMRKKLFFSAWIFAVVALLVGAYFLFAVPKSTGTGQKTVTLEITAGEKTLSMEVKTNKQFVFEVLEDVADEIDLVYNTDYGSPFVTGFLGVEAEGNFWYAFFINGEASFVGVADAPIADGDTISFLLTESWTPDYVGVDSNLWVFLMIAGLLVCISLMAYMIVKDEKQ